jgi:hypothetical protein
MGFTRGQQPEFRVLVKQAWGVHCRTEGIDSKDSSHRAWYEGELLFATGHDSTTSCNAGRDYDRAMAHFEALAMAGIKWQMKIHTGDANRILFQLQEITDEHGIDADYLRGVARQMLRREELPELHRLTRDQLILILGEVKRHVRRRKNSGKL